MENAGTVEATSLPLLRLPPLPKHLRHPSNPPPTGPLPRPPSTSENRDIAARLSASSPPPPGTLRPKLTAYPFPATSETRERDVDESSHTPVHNAPTPESSSASQLSPSISLPNNSNSPSSTGRQLSAHTQASSDALGENNLPLLPATLPPLDQNGRKSSAISAGDSRYSGSGLLASREGAGPDKQIPDSRFDRSVVSLEDLQYDSRCLSRLSRLSYISGGAAFVVSEENEGRRRNSNPSYKIDTVLPDFEIQHRIRPARPGTHDVNGRYDPHINSTLGKPGDLNMRIHPADNRFEHTYRMRKASEAEEPIYVPVYNFEPPGKFPDRSRLTAPLATPKFLNHTPRNFSLPGRADGGPAPRFSGDSAEILLGGNGNHGGIVREIQVPPRAYDAEGRTPRAFRSPLARKPSVVASNLSDRNRIESDGRSPRKETARQRFEREHDRYFHDLDRLEELHRPASSIPRAQIHGPKYLVSRYGTPTLGRTEDSYTGKEINEGRWPERYKRQKRIGRSLLCICVAMPPLWLIMAVGLLDNLVAEMTGGEIWGVGRAEKALAAWFGGVFCFALITTIIVVSILIL